METELGWETRLGDALIESILSGVLVELFAFEVAVDVLSVIFPVELVIGTLLVASKGFLCSLV